jgi:hypothetical protein
VTTDGAGVAPQSGAAAPSPAGSARAGTIVALAAGLAVLAIAVAVQSPQPAGVFWDDGVYLISARALAAGEGYRFTHLPGAPAAVHFPPGWPLLLAVLWKVWPDFPANLAMFRYVNPVLGAGAAALACAYGVRRLRLGPVASAVATVVFAATLPVLVLYGVLFAEPLFLLLSICALFVSDRAVREGGVATAACAGAMAGAAALVRSTGLAFLAAVPLALLLARRRREAVVACSVMLAFVAPWQFWTAAHAADLAPPFRGNYGPYLPWLLDAVRDRGAPFLFAIAAENVQALQRTLSVVFFPVGVRPVRPLLVVLLVVVFALGFHAAWRRSRVFCLAAAAYAVIVLFWPYAPDRFAWAVWPLAGLVLALGAAEAAALARHVALPRDARLACASLAVVAAAAVVGAAFYSARGVSRGWADIAQRRNAARLRPVVEWVNTHTDPGDVVVADGEPLVHLYTGRRVVPAHVLTPDEYLAGTSLRVAADDLRALLRAGHATWAVFSARALEADAADLVSSAGGSPRLVPVDTLPGGGVAYRVDWSP